MVVMSVALVVVSTRRLLWHVVSVSGFVASWCCVGLFRCRGDMALALLDLLVVADTVALLFCMLLVLLTLSAFR